MLRPGPAVTFVVRVRAEPTPAVGYSWQGLVLQVQTGRQEAFRDFDGLVRILQRSLRQVELQGEGGEDAPLPDER